MNARLVYMTAGTVAEAQTIGRAIVEEGLVACVNIIDGMQSIYRWDGKVCEDAEVVIVAKTTADQVKPLVARVKEIHSYACPCVVALPILEGNPEYLEWLIRD